MSVWKWLEDDQAARERAGLVRRLRPRAADETEWDLAGNDYLGLSRHPAVVEAAAEAAVTWGCGSTGSRLVTGSTRLHAELEEELADFCGYEAAAVFSSGYCANLGVLAALGGEGALLVSDARNHASLIDGCRLARGSVTVIPHRDPVAAGAALAAHDGRGLMITDAVFSVDGETAPLRELAEVCRRSGAVLLADEAHGLGVSGPGGRGALAAAALAGDEDVVATVTLSKALGSQGGAVLGPRKVIDYLHSTARTFIFDTGLAPAAVAGALAALRHLRAEPGLSVRVAEHAAWFRVRLAEGGLEAGGGDGSAVVSVRAPSPAAAVAWARGCAELGVRVGCFRPPSVPDGVSRLRLTVRADLPDGAREYVAKAVLSMAPV